jgi:hypothetical protein
MTTENIAKSPKTRGQYSRLGNAPGNNCTIKLCREWSPENNDVLGNASQLAHSGYISPGFVYIEAIKREDRYYRERSWT